MTGSDDLRYHGTELVLLYDYKAQGKLNSLKGRRHTQKNYDRNYDRFSTRRLIC